MSAAKRGAELLSLGLVPQLHRPEVFAPWNRVPGSILARGGQQQRWAADYHDSIKKRETKIKGSCLLVSVLFSCCELVLTWPACGRATAWNCSLQARYFNFISHCGSKTGSGSSRVLALRTAYHLLLWLCCYSLPPEADTWRWWRTSSLSSISPCTSCWGGIFPISAATGDSVEPSATALLPPVACAAFSCSSHTKEVELSLPVWTNCKTLGTAGLLLGHQLHQKVFFCRERPCAMKWAGALWLWAGAGPKSVAASF